MPAEVMELQEKMAAFGPLNCAIVSGAAAGDFPDPRAKHPFFYGIHATELLHTLLGSGAQAVTTRRTERCDIALVDYDDGRQGGRQSAPQNARLLPCRRLRRRR